MISRLLHKWWFWIALPVVLVAVWWFWGYFAWLIGQQDMRAENRSAYLGWLKMGADQKLLEQQYKNDTYGGETPEETLRLFVEALEKNDYNLAAKYYVPERQQEELDSINISAQNSFIDEYIAVIKYNHKISYSRDKKSADVDFYDRTGSQVHFAQMILNPYTKRWKFESI